MSNISQNIKIHAGFPGGNIIVEEYHADYVNIRSDLSMCSTWWFWWCFEAENLSAEPYTVRFSFSDGAPFGSAGPCVNVNNTHWHWLGRECIEGNTFEFKFTPEMKSCRFAFSIPYVQSDLEAFLKNRPGIVSSSLAKTKENRSVELLHIPSKTGKYAVYFTARHHACECIANYVLEGLMDCRLRNDGFLAQNVDFYVVPFMDKDGVENGDQGKNRYPHDHNRDYGPFIYSSTAAYVELLKRNRSRNMLLLDIHCPNINDSHIFLVEPEPSCSDSFYLFRDMMNDVQQGQLHYYGKNDIAFGTEWNNASLDCSCSRYAQDELGIRNAFTLEVPYAEADGIRINEDRARMLGYDICRTVEQFAVRSNTNK